MGLRAAAAISQRYPKTIIALWFILLLLLGMHAQKLPSVLQDHGLAADGEHRRVQQQLAEQFHIPDQPVILLFEREAQLSTTEFQRFIRLAVQRLQQIPGVSDIKSPLDHPAMLKGNYAYALLTSSFPSYELEPLLQTAAAKLPVHDGASVTMTGKSVIQRDVNEASERDLRNAEMIGIPIAFIVLVYAFRGIVPAILPSATGLISVTVSMGIMYLLGRELPLSNFVINVIPMVGLALSIDFALLIVSRFREELAAADTAQALAETFRTAGSSVLLSGGCAGLGLAGILLIPLPIFASVALSAIVVLAVSVLVTLTLLPALLTVMSSALRMNGKHASIRQKRSIWQPLASIIMRRPVFMGLLASTLLIIMLMPLNKMDIAIPDAASLPQHYASRSASGTFELHFGSPDNAYVYMIVQSGSKDWKEGAAAEANRIVNMLERDPFVAGVDSVFSALPRDKRRDSAESEKYAPIWGAYTNEGSMLIHVMLKEGAKSEASMDWVRKWSREGALSDTLQWQVGGEAKFEQEVFDAIFNNIKYVAAFIFTANFVLLAFAFRSILIPLKTIVMNALSLGASYGLIAWIFEEGIGGIETGSIAIMIPVFIFGLVFGISMDYGVFLISRIYEAYRKSGNNEEAVLSGLTSTSRMITSAAAILIAVTAPFALGEVAGVKQLGIGIAAAILVDATIIRLVLVPSLMKLFGRWNWWTPWNSPK